MGWLSSARKKEEGDEIFQMYFKSKPITPRAFPDPRLLQRRNTEKKYFLYVTIMDQKRAVEYIKMWYLSTVRSIVC